MMKQFSNDKALQQNISLEMAKNLTAKWEKVELNRFRSALRPTSFREAKKALDRCLEEG